MLQLPESSLHCPTDEESRAVTRDEPRIDTAVSLGLMQGEGRPGRTATRGVGAEMENAQWSLPVRHFPTVVAKVPTGSRW